MQEEHKSILWGLSGVNKEPLVFLFFSVGDSCVFMAWVGLSLLASALGCTPTSQHAHDRRRLNTMMGNLYNDNGSFKSLHGSECFCCRKI